jgi:hypothetical protein
MEQHRVHKAARLLERVLWIFVTRVRIQGLTQSTQHNGKLAVIIAQANPQNGRFGVRMENKNEGQKQMTPTQATIFAGE